MKANNLTNFKGQKYAIDNDYTAWQIYANNATIPVGSNSTLGGYVSVAISAQMTESFVIRSNQDYSENDAKIDWGDGNTSFIRKQEYSLKTLDGEQKNFIFEHTYTTPGKYIIKVFGKDYFSVTHLVSAFTNQITERSLLCRCMDADLPIASHITNISSFAYKSFRLLKVNNVLDVNRFSNFSKCFQNCTNLKTVTGFNHLLSAYAMTFMFRDCTNLVTCDLIFPPIITKYRGLWGIFYNCPQLSNDVSSFFPIGGILSKKVSVYNWFSNCTKLTGTVPGNLLWNNPNANWTEYTDGMFYNCSPEILAQVPKLWKGTASNSIIQYNFDADIYINNHAPNTANGLVKLDSYGKISNDIITPPNDGVLTIKRNNVSVGTFNANSSTSTSINITVPTTASDVNALPSSTKYGKTFDLSLSNSDYVMSLKLKDQDGNVLSSNSIDLPLETMVVNGYYNSNSQSVVLELKNGNEVSFSVADLVSGLQSTLTAGRGIDINNDVISEIDNDYTAWQVYANDTAIQVGENAILGGYVSNPIPMKMTQGFYVRSDYPYSTSDVIVDWGDGNISRISEGEYTKRIVRSEDFAYYMQHTYTTSGKYIIKIMGKDYFALSHYLTLYDKTLDNSKNLVCRVLDEDLPIASHLVNLSNLFCMSDRLLNVNCPHRSMINQVTNMSWMFKACKNLLSVTGFDRPYATMNSISRMFASNANMVTCDMVLPISMTDAKGYERVFDSCTSWQGDIATVIPPLGFVNQNVDVREIFKNCVSLTGTIPASSLWERVDKDWTYTSDVFTGCNENIRSQAPVSWGGTNEQIVVPTRTSKEQTLQSIHNLSVLHTSVMPTASVSNFNEVYYYTGISNENFIQGKPYICKLVSGVYTWVELSPKSAEVNNVTNPIAWKHYKAIELMWTDPSPQIIIRGQVVAQWAKTVIVMKENSIPSSINDGVSFEVTTWNTHTNNPLILSNPFADSENPVYIRWFTVTDNDVVNENNPTYRQLDDLSWDELRNILDSSNSNCRINLQNRFALGDVVVVDNNTTKHSGYNGYAWQVIDVNNSNMALMAKKVYQTVKFDVPQKNKGMVEPEIYQEDYCLKASNGLTFYLIKSVPLSVFTEGNIDDADISDTRTWKAEDNNYYYELICYHYIDDGGPERVESDVWKYRKIQQGTTTPLSGYNNIDFTLTNYTPYWISEYDTDYYANVTSDTTVSDNHTYYRISNVDTSNSTITSMEFGEMGVVEIQDDDTTEGTYSDGNAAYPSFSVPSKIYKIEVFCQFINGFNFYGRNNGGSWIKIFDEPNLGEFDGPYDLYEFDITYAQNYDEYMLTVSQTYQGTFWFDIYYGNNENNAQFNSIYID